MIQSAAYEIIKREGFKEGIEYGMKEGLEQGLQQGLRDSIFQTLEVRFGVIPSKVISRIERITDPETLRSIHREALKSSSIEEFEEKMEKMLG